MGGAIVVEVIGRHISYEGRENALSHFCIASRCIDQGDVPIDSPSDTDRAVPQALLHDPELTPIEIRMVAALWRKSWKRSTGNPGSCSNWLTSWIVTLSQAQKSLW